MGLITPNPIQVLGNDGIPVFRYSIYREEHAFTCSNSTLQGDETSIQPADIYCYKILFENLCPTHYLIDISAKVVVRVTSNPLITGPLPLPWDAAQNINFIEPWPGGASSMQMLPDPGMMNCDLVYFRNVRPFTEENLANGLTKTVSAFAFTTKNMHEGSKFEFALKFRWRRATEQTCFVVGQPESDANPAVIGEVTEGD